MLLGEQKGTKCIAYVLQTKKAFYLPFPCVFMCYGNELLSFFKKNPFKVHCGHTRYFEVCIEGSW
jgi:hypothetical protein